MKNLLLSAIAIFSCTFFSCKEELLEPEQELRIESITGTTWKHRWGDDRSWVEHTIEVMHNNTAIHTINSSSAKKPETETWTYIYYYPVAVFEEWWGVGVEGIHPYVGLRNFGTVKGETMIVYLHETVDQVQMDMIFQKQ